jgi:hypothetical protein
MTKARGTQKGTEMDTRQELRNRVLKGVAVFDEHVPDWRVMVKKYDPTRANDILQALFGFSSKYDKDCIPELYRRRLAGRRGRGSANASEQAFWHEVGICLYPDEAGSYDELMDIWREFIG